jgi:hypothetical protein
MRELRVPAAVTRSPNPLPEASCPGPIRPRKHGFAQPRGNLLGHPREERADHTVASAGQDPPAE